MSGTLADLDKSCPISFFPFFVQEMYGDFKDPYSREEKYGHEKRVAMQSAMGFIRFRFVVSRFLP